MKKISYLLFCGLILLLNPLHSQETVNPEAITLLKRKVQYPGGETGLEKYLADNMRYPEVAIDNCIQGTVIVKFVVTTKGEITDPDVVHYAHPLLNKEALRLVKAMPKWIPSTQDEEAAVTVRFKLDCEPESFCGFVADSLLTRKDIDGIDDSLHPDKLLLEGQWKFKSFDIDVHSKDKKEVKEIKKRFEKVTKGEGRTIYKELKRMKLDFYEDNSVRIEIDDVDNGVYRLRDNKMLMYSTVGGVQVMNYEVNGSTLKIEVDILTPNPKIKGTARIIFKREKGTK